MNLGDADNLMEHHNMQYMIITSPNMINTSPKNSTTYQCAPSHAGYFRISIYLCNGSLFWLNNIFLNDLCHYMIFSISEFPANIFTFITHELAQASNIHTRLTYGRFPRFYFFNFVSMPCTSIIAIHEPYFFPYMALNTNIILETNLYPQQYHY